MIHPHTELQYISKEIGHGVVATQFIPKGTITWALDKLDREFTPEVYEGMEELYKEILEFYSFTNAQGNYVLCWDHGRYVNHSFDSNCLTTAYDFEIAIRDIHPGEQLTDDYGYLNISEPFKGIDEGTRRKTVYPDDLVKYAKVWDRKLAAVFHRIPKLEQPLRQLISESVWQEVLAVVEGKKAMESIGTNYFDRKR